MTRFQGRTVLVTGASSGLGLASARRFADEGARVVLVSRSAERLESARAGLPGAGHIAIPCDCGNASATADMGKRIKDDGITIDSLVLAAGSHLLRPFQVMKEQHLTEVLQNNLFSTLNPIRGVLGSLSAGGSAIVGITSVAATRGGAGVVGYSAAKGAVVSALRALAVELAGRKIRVNWVSAGVVRTPMSDTFLERVGPEAAAQIERAHLLGLGEPSHVASAVAFLASDDAAWITGAEFTVDGGLSCH